MARGGGLIFLFLVFILLLNPLIYGQLDDSLEAGTTTSQVFSPDKSYEWLYQKLANVTLPSDATDVRALVTITLMQRGSGSMSGFLTELRELEDEVQHCWPNTGCTIKDTALATLAMALAGEDVSQEVGWLQAAKIAGLQTGGEREWSIAIKADSDGACAFNFAGASVERQFTLEGDRVIAPGGSYTQQQYYVRLNEVHPSLGASIVQPEITVACEVTNPIITLLYKPSANTFFIQRSDAGASVNFKVANACYGNVAGTGPCDYESTAFATWALLEIGLIKSETDLTLENIGTHIYLESQAVNKRSDPIALGLLNRILIRASSAAPSFISDLVNLQRISDGSWGNSVVATSIASFGLTGSDRGDAVARGLDYLRSAVRDDGSWNGDVEASSWALIALHGGDLSRVSIPGGVVADSGAEICGNSFDDDSDGILDCGEIECASDPSCNRCQNNIKDVDEEETDCGGSCPFECTPAEEEECTTDADCFASEVCVSGNCVVQSTTTSTEDESECTRDLDCSEGYVCEDSACVLEEEKSLLWLWISVIILVLGGFAFFYVKYVRTGKVSFGNLFRKKPKEPTFEQFRREAEFKPARPAQPQKPFVRQPIQPIVRKPVATNKSKEDIELERSMREAERILKGE